MLFTVTMMASTRARRGLAVLMSFLWLAQLSHVAAETQYIYGTGADGETRELALDRNPALYTGDFADCLGGGSLFNITKFDAAYYADNMTVLFHLDGSTNIRNESLMSMAFSQHFLAACANENHSDHHHGSM